MPRLKILEKTIKKLFALSGNICAFPDCTQAIVNENEDIIGQICHIEAAEENGPRFNKDQSDEARRSFENLIILCPNHHVITHNINIYSVEKLKQIKAKHENKYKNKQYQISNHLLKKLNQAININNPKQVVINQNFGLSGSEIKELFTFLLETNFPRLKEIAREEVDKNFERFYSTFINSLNHINYSVINYNVIQRAFLDPDFQYILNNAITTAVRQNNDLLRNILSLLLLKRIMSQDEDLKKIITNEAIITVSRLTKNQLNILTIMLLAHNQLQLTKVGSWDDLNSYFNNIQPFININNYGIDFSHIKYCGCATSVGGFAHTSIWSILSTKFKFLFDNNSQENINSFISSKLALGKDLIILPPSIWYLDLTSVGIVIAASHFEVVTNNYALIDLNNYFKVKIETN
jgi:hypothetical protein